MKLQRTYPGRRIKRQRKRRREDTVGPENRNFTSEILSAVQPAARRPGTHTPESPASLLAKGRLCTQTWPGLKDGRVTADWG